jgi:hypothetical protein
MKDFKTHTINIHLFSSLLVVGLLYLLDAQLAKSLLGASFVFNLYLRSLFFSFDLSKENSKILMGISSGLRAFCTALALAILIINFQLSLTGLALAFVLYKLILITLVIFGNKTNGSTSHRN